MSNKTSDKNVGNIEELIKEYKTYNDLDGIQDLQPYIRALQNILADYTRQKQINEEHRKLNGELRERVKELEENLKKFYNGELLFGDIVVVEGSLIGVVVKCWIGSALTNPIRKYDVYVRYYDSIKQYDENNIERYRVRHKYLDEEELNYQKHNDFKFYKKLSEYKEMLGDD